MHLRPTHGTSKSYNVDMTNSEIQIEVRDSLEDIPASQWNALSCDGNPFLKHEFLHTLDETGCLGDRTGWYPRYFLLWKSPGDSNSSCDARELIGAAPAYIKTNSYGEFVFDWAWADAYQRHQLDYYPKLVSGIPFTPATGRRLLSRDDQPFEQTVQLLAAGMRQYARNESFSSVHFLFITQAESEVLCRASMKDIPAQSRFSQDSKTDDESTSLFSDEVSLEMPCSDHLQRLDCQYHWHNDSYADFDDFLSRCTAKRRKTIKRERRYVSDAGLRLEQRKGTTLNEQEWRWVHQFYSSTYDRKWGNPSLTLKFFENVGRLMGEQVLIVFAYDPDDEEPGWPVACSIMFVGKSTLYGRFWGCRADFNALHFEACYYQGIEYCIANGIQHFEPGAQGEHKITRGFVPTITRSAHFIQHSQFRDAIADYLTQERAHVEQRCKGLSDLLPFKHEPLTV